MDKKRSEIIKEIRDYLYEDEHHAWHEGSSDDSYAFAEVKSKNLLEILQETPAIIQWDGKGLISLVPNRNLGFKFELEYCCHHWNVSSAIHIDELLWTNYGGYQEAYNRFKYISDKNHDAESIETLRVLLHDHLWNECDWDERFFIEQLLRNKGGQNGWLIDAAYNLFITKFSGSSWLSVELENDEIIMTPDVGYGPPIVFCYDSEVFRIRICDTEVKTYEEYWIEQANNKLLALLDAKITNGVIHRQSIYRKNESETINNLMDKLLDKDFRDADERCFIEMLLRERKVPENWFQRFSPNYEASSIKYYRETLKEKIFNPIFYLTNTTVVILSIGFLGSIFIFIFGKYEPVLPYWDFIGPILAITHLLAVGIVAFSCFDDLIVDMRYDDIGPVSHQVGWFAVATACFPVGYPIGLIAKLISDCLVKRFESELEGRSRERIVYQLKDLTGPIPLGRVWIPTFLFGTTGTAYWYYLPFIYGWLLS